MTEKNSSFTDSLIHQFEQTGIDLQRPATIEDVLNIVGGALDTVVRMQASEKAVDQMLDEMKRRR